MTFELNDRAFTWQAQERRGGEKEEDMEREEIRKTKCKNGEVSE